MMNKSGQGGIADTLTGSQNCLCNSDYLLVFFALFKILKINEIGVCECTMVYFDVLKVYCVFWMLQFVDVNLCAKQEKL